jgi:murein peptide amidase A
MIDIPILTIELPYADVMPTQSEINEIWENLITWLNENV